MIGPFKYIHSILGLGTLMLTGILWNKIQDKTTINVKVQIKWLLNIFILEVGLGYFMVFGGLPIYMKLLHMWLASISIGIIMYVLIDTRVGIIK